MDIAIILDVIRTIITSVAMIVAVLQLANQYTLRRLQTLFSLNERLTKHNEAFGWINNPSRDWSDLEPDEQQA